MMRWVRPAGVVGFIALAILVTVGWWLLSGWLLKATIETVGTKLVGARVEVRSATLSLLPMGFHLKGLQVTNPDRPMQNMVEVASAAGTVEPVKLLFGQVIIDDLSSQGVRFNTPRKTSGALAKPPPAAKGEAQGPGPVTGAVQAVKGKLPSADEILKRANLVTEQRVNDLKESEKTQRTRVEQAVKALPDENKVKDYQKRLHEITGGKVTSLDDLRRREQQLQKLKDEVRKDKDAVVNARKSIDDAKKVLSERFSALKNAPAEDLRRIGEQYGLNMGGVSSLTRLLFGDNARKWFDLIRTWYGRLERLLPSGESAPQPLQPRRGQGHYVRFPTTRPLPDFLLRRADLSTELPIGKVAVKLTDVTPQPQVLGRPMRLEGSGRDLPHAKAVQVAGTFDHVNPRTASDRFKWNVSGWRVTDAHLSQADAFPLTLAAARVNLSGDATLRGGSLDAAVDGVFDGARWSSSARGAAAQVVDALSGITAFTVRGKVSGSLASPDLSLSSNLDQKIKGAVLAKLKSGGGELEKKLRARLNDRVQQAAGPYRQQVGALTDTQGTLQTRLNSLDDMLQAKLQSALKSQEDKAKEKLKDKLKGLGF